MHETVFNYVRKFYSRANSNVKYVYENYYLSDLSIDAFFENWTINFCNGSDPEYRLYDGTTIEAYYLYRLVHEDSKKGFFIREMREHSVHYHFTELGKEYLLFKLGL